MKHPSSVDFQEREIENLRARVAELEAAQEQWRKTASAHAAAEARLAGILNISEDAIISVDSDLRLRMFNKGAEKIFGYKAAEVIGQPLHLLLPEKVRDVHREHMVRFGYSAETARRMGQRQEIAGRRKDGSEFPAEASISKFRQADQMIFTVVLRDISDRKQKEERLRQSHDELRLLGARLESVREEERRSIAREVHDELGQALTALKMRLTALVKEAAGQPQHQEKLKQLVGNVSEIMETVRRIATHLRPSLLDPLGLEAAIESHLQEFQETTGIEVETELDSVAKSIAPDLAINLFRISQEALTNVARHSRATRVNVSLRRTDYPPSLRLEVADNGVGFDPGGVTQRSLGLLGMRERALRFGGDVSIESAPDKGARVTATIPLGGDQRD